MCTITWSLEGFNQLIPMLVLLSCHYRECVQVRLPQQKMRRHSLKVRKREQEPTFCPQVSREFGDQGNKSIPLSYLSVLVWGMGDAGKRDSCCGFR